nr:RNA-directed DNA polymerase, eukaryota [Tanacetum cinerariifolium]
GQFQTGSYVNVVNGSFPVGVHGPFISFASVLVLDDSCVAERDLSNHVMGIPLNVWSRETFTRTGKKWGEALDIEDNVNSSFGRKRLCIKTKLPLSILESFKVIFKGKVYMVRAKELFTWNPIFLGQKEMEYTSDDDFDVGPQKVPDRS